MASFMWMLLTEPSYKRTLLGVRLASEEEVGRYFTDCELGAIPALRHWRGVDAVSAS